MPINDTDTKQTIASNLQNCREKSGKSVAALAEEIGIARGYWYEIERGEVNVTIDMLERIASALGVTVRDLLEPRSRKGRKAS